MRVHFKTTQERDDWLNKYYPERDLFYPLTLRDNSMHSGTRETTRFELLPDGITILMISMGDRQQVAA